MRPQNANKAKCDYCDGRQLHHMVDSGAKSVRSRKATVALSLGFALREPLRLFQIGDFSDPRCSRWAVSKRLFRLINSDGL